VEEGSGAGGYRGRPVTVDVGWVAQSMGAGKGLASVGSSLCPAQKNNLLCELFKNIQTSLNWFDSRVDFLCSKICK
jgi:hypothetical protein